MTNGERRELRHRVKATKRVKELEEELRLSRKNTECWRGRFHGQEERYDAKWKEFEKKIEELEKRCGALSAQLNLARLFLLQDLGIHA